MGHVCVACRREGIDNKWMGGWVDCGGSLVEEWTNFYSCLCVLCGSKAKRREERESSAICMCGLLLEGGGGGGGMKVPRSV